MPKAAKASLTRIGNEPLDELTQAICEALPFAPELSNREVPLEPSVTVSTFRHRALSEEERTRLIAALKRQGDNPILQK